MSDLFWKLLAKQIRVTHHTYNSPHFRPWHLRAPPYKKDQIVSKSGISAIQALTQTVRMPIEKTT